MKDKAPAGWIVGQSIAKELDIALSVAGGQFQTGEVSTGPAGEFARSLPADWLAQWPEFLGKPRDFISVMGIAAMLAGVETEPDYSRATLAIRELSVREALHRATAQRLPLAVKPDPSLPPAAALVDLISRTAPLLSESLGLELVSRTGAVRDAACEAEGAVRILKGGALHARFWHWLDRAYWEWYRPWRESQADAVALQEEQAIKALGAREGSAPPDIAWVPDKNALRSYPELAAAVQEGRLRLFFWAQPFGLFDYWNLGPGLLTVAYADPTMAFESFRALADDLAERTKALSDPTRLTILRMIRQFSRDNTQMADFLGLARPTVSIHAKVLREAGLIETWSEGRAVRHRVNAAAVRRLFRDLELFLDLPDDE